MKIALALIVKNTKDEAKVLDRCLSGTSKHVDGIFITVTGEKGFEIDRTLKSVLSKHKAYVSKFTWVNDFSKARNFNFIQVPKEYDYIMWLDADDMVRGMDKLRKSIKDNPKVDCFALSYLYAFDEYKNPTVVHQKTQIVKNDGCVEWVGALHEDFKENRSIQRYLIRGIDRLHLTDDIRISDSKERNVLIAREDAKKKPKDPRSYWNLGNALKSAGYNEEAIKYLRRFLNLSNSEEEKYIVHLRISELYLNEKRYADAAKHAQQAIGIRPHYPDAYHMVGHVMFAMSQFEKAALYYLQGLEKKPAYFNIIAYNPRDYDYHPLMSLAKCYFNLNQPIQALALMEACVKIYPKNKLLKRLVNELDKEAKNFESSMKEVEKLKKIKDKDKLKKAIDKLPDDIRSHPLVCNLRNLNFIKQKSSGKDLVIYCGLTQKEWHPGIAQESGVGGSEEAVIHLSKIFAEAGWNVTVYNNCGHKELKFGNVTYKPYWSWNYRDKQDVVILWRSPKATDYDINCKNIILDLHDVIDAGELTEKRLEKINKIMVKSNFHRSIYSNIPDSKFSVVPNGIDVETFKGEFDKDPYLIINTSSPDRSISALIKGFKIIKKAIPEAKMKWAYGWGVFDIVHGEDPNVMAWKEEIEKEIKELDGFEALGMISHDEVANLYKEATIFAYPTEFAEIDCISLSKAQAAGAYPVTTDFAALGEKKFGGTFIHSDKTKDNWVEDYQYDFSLEDDKVEEWANKVIEQMTDRTKVTNINSMRKEALEKYDWNKIANEWNKVLSNV